VFDRRGDEAALLENLKNPARRHGGAEVKKNLTVFMTAPFSREFV